MLQLESKIEYLSQSQNSQSVHDVMFEPFVASLLGKGYDSTILTALRVFASQ
jgi:hypothetical protein